MKTLIRFVCCAACIALFATCQKADQVMDDLSGVQLKQAQPITVTLPLTVEGYTFFKSISDDPDECGVYPIQKVVVEGPMNGNQLGRFIFQTTFCNNVETGEILSGTGAFIAANGDLLFPVTNEMTPVLPADENDPPYYAQKWDGKGIFTGGTGRFEGASGEYIMHGYNSNRPGEENMSFHYWTGTITMVKGKR